MPLKVGWVREVSVTMLARELAARLVHNLMTCQVGFQREAARALLTLEVTAGVRVVRGITLRYRGRGQGLLVAPENNFFI